jgi:predicted ATPase
MYVSRLDLANIRCYVEASVVFSPTITLIAGENNSGKSTVIHALLLLQAESVDLDWVRQGALEGSIRISLAEINPALFPPQTRGIAQNATGPNAAALFDLNVERNSRNSRLETGIAPQVSQGTYYPFPRQQPTNLIVPYLSERRASKYSEAVGGNAAYTAAGNLENLVAKIDRCLSSLQLNPRYQAACMAVLGFVVTTHPTASGKMAGLELDAQEQRYIPLTRMGAGVAQVLGLVVELLVAKNKLFLIEEIENDLHPSALRKLLELVEVSALAGNQFVISTHSSVVLRALGSVAGTKLWQTVRVNMNPPESKLAEVLSEPRARRALLQALGYDLVDYDLYDAWLILEESSAERLVREFIIPWFAARLGGRIRTLAAQGASDVEPRFVDLHRLFVFIHLEPIYRQRAWVLTDGDDVGREAAVSLRRAFFTWPEEHFAWFSEPAFEHYYPAEFEERVREVLAIGDRERLRQQKKQLLEDVVAWLREDRARGEKALEISAQEVIARIRGIESAVAGASAG